MLIFCADNGIVEEGVSQTGQEVTLAVAKSMARKGSSVCKMAQSIGAETIPVDIGINSEESIPGVWNRKVCPGTRNFLKEPAMTEEETVRAIATGIGMVRECKEKDYGILATGEMGIGNTTTSSAVTAALLQCGAEEVTGRGAGLTDQGLARKQQVVRTPWKPMTCGMLMPSRYCRQSEDWTLQDLPVCASAARCGIYPLCWMV